MENKKIYLQNYEVNLPKSQKQINNANFYMVGTRNNSVYNLRKINVNGKLEEVDIYLGRLRVNNAPIMLTCDFFLCNVLELHIKKFSDASFIFPECNYFCKKIEIHIKDCEIPGKNRFINIDNTNCPVDIEIKIYKESDFGWDGSYYILSTQKGKVTVECSIPNVKPICINI